MKILAGALLIIFVTFLCAILGGAIIWITYPHIHAVFPQAVSSGILAPELGFWDSVCISWLFTALFKSFSYSSK